MHTTFSSRRPHSTEHADVSIAPGGLPSDRDDDLSTTSLVLLRRAQAGDPSALDRLLDRYRQPLVRWARGRLPRGARDLLDTEDIVQETLIRSLRHVGDFEPAHRQGLLAYLRRAVRNRIHDEQRRMRRQGDRTGVSKAPPDVRPTPLEEAVGRDALKRYEHALEQLRPHDREAVIARVELGLSYRDIAATLDKPSADAARMAVKRALRRLAEAMVAHVHANDGSDHVR
ncbi:MAG: sigma-70 family RNA polymerase sigma factor [Acidobacteriota bacterium]